MLYKRNTLHLNFSFVYKNILQCNSDYLPYNPRCLCTQSGIPALQQFYSLLLHCKYLLTEHGVVQVLPQWASIIRPIIVAALIFDHCMQYAMFKLHSHLQ